MTAKGVGMAISIRDAVALLEEKGWRSLDAEAKDVLLKLDIRVAAESWRLVRMKLRNEISICTLEQFRRLERVRNSSGFGPNVNQETVAAVILVRDMGWEWEMIPSSLASKVTLSSDIAEKMGIKVYPRCGGGVHRLSLVFKSL